LATGFYARCHYCCVALRDLPFPAEVPTDLQAVVGRRVIEVSLRTHESPAARLYVFRCDDSW